MLRKEEDVSKGRLFFVVFAAGFYSFASQPVAAVIEFVIGVSLNVNKADLMLVSFV